MGIPGFYRWLVKRYPKVVSCVQDPSSNTSSPNPNGVGFDNFYLDMNGIIHPCFHPDDPDELQPTSFEEVFNSVFEYVDRLFNIVQPTKLLYFAIDGVSPRAKLDVQRAGRYQKAKEKEISEQEEDRLRSKYKIDGKKLLPKVKSQVDDSNIISSGTEFMYEFSKALECYIQTRLKENPAWKNLKVILSDANVPGEGEHKIVSFIRSQRSLPGYDVNTRHCLHGLDADLIMLALATHELRISILREVSIFRKIEGLAHQFQVNLSSLKAGEFRASTNVNQMRSLGAPVTTSSGLSSSNSREGLYNHPNWSNRDADLRDARTANHRGSFRPRGPKLDQPRSHTLNWRDNLERW